MVQSVKHSHENNENKNLVRILEAESRCGSGFQKRISIPHDRWSILRGRNSRVHFGSLFFKFEHLSLKKIEFWILFIDNFSGTNSTPETVKHGGGSEVAAVDATKEHLQSR